jgi:hypothetical protein
LSHPKPSQTNSFPEGNETENLGQKGTGKSEDTESHRQQEEYRTTYQMQTSPTLFPFGFWDVGRLACALQTEIRRHSSGKMNVSKNNPIRSPYC